MNDHLFYIMRTKDEIKQEAVIKATIKKVNEIGFASSSVSKIAREAGISPATIYIYYKNKEDLLVSTYIEIKRKIALGILRDFNAELPIRDILKNMWHSAFNYFQSNSNMFQYAEQFSNSPYSDLVKKQEIDIQFEPIFKVLQKGIKKKIIKDVNMDLITAFIFFPIITLANNKVCQNFKIDNKGIDEAFTLAWDAIKL